MSLFSRASGVTWRPTRSLAGVTWVAVAAMTASALAPVQDAQDQPTIQLLNSTWDDAEPLRVANDLIENSVADPDIVDAEVEVIIDDASSELTDATAALDDTVVEVVGGQVVVTAPTDDELALLDKLDEAEQVLQDAEAVFAEPGAASDSEVADVTDELVEVLEETDALVEAAIEDASSAQLVELEQADEALDNAVAAISESSEVDAGYITDLGGWVPNLRYAIDRRGPRRRLSGEGIDIAIIDSGITPVPGLDGADKIINGPDLSADGANPDLISLDLNGHGTHLAGIIAGNDSGPAVDGTPHFTGIAPDARLINVKVADGEGNTSVEQLVAGIEWVIANKNANGMDIRVLNLAFGYNGDTDDMPDPIAAALEEAWANGIVVVVAAGNRGNDSNGIDHPAHNSYVMAIAGSDQQVPTNLRDDTIAPWSSAGDNVRNPDLAAPGRSIVSLRVPGSYSDSTHPESRIGSRFAVASGTSQASAVMSGTIALLLQKNPSLTPDQVKNLFTDGARSIAPGETLDGEGMVLLNRALWRLRTDRQGPATQQNFGRLPLPERFGAANGGWSGGSWAGGSWAGASWTGTSWSGGSWAGGSWAGGSWAGGSWAGASWTGASWTGASWTGASWSGASWSGASWSGASWTGTSWSGASWG